ncbi:MAG: amidohydrolase family protein [Planctomycetota bacterium]
MLILSNLAKLYDGTSSRKDALHERVDLHIDKGRIAGLVPHDPALKPTALGADAGTGQRSAATASAAASSAASRVVIDCSGLVATPGLVDCHGHVTILGLDTPAMDTMLGGAWLLYVEKILHATLVDGGVTTMRDVGGATALIKRLVEEGTLLGPRLKIAICMLSTTGGHADFRGPDRCHGELSRLWPEAPGRPSSIVDGPWEARKRVREIAACGADLIKLCTSPGIASPGDALEHRDFTGEEIAAICDEAAGRGLRVAAHAHSQSGIALAIEHGVSDIQHISFMDERLVEQAHRKGCTVTPTSWVMQALPGAKGLSPFVMEKVKKAGEVHARAVQFAAQGGLKILAGTDPVLPGMHGTNYREIAALVSDGLPALAAWHGMTGLAAAEIGQSDAGTLRPGQRADVLLWRGDVLAEPKLLEPKTAALVEVLKDGVGHRGLAGVPQRAFSDTVRAALQREG